jgi:copper chaperone CopZ
MDRVTLTIDGMSCGGCVKHVSAALNALPGVRVDRVSVGSAEVQVDPAASSVDAVVSALAASGYPARASRSAAASGGPRPSPGSAGGGCCCG